MPDLIAAAQTVTDAAGGKAFGSVMRGQRSASLVDTMTGVVLNAWGGRWLVPSGGPAYQLVHRACGQVITPLVRCSHCHTALLPEAVTNARRLRKSL
jgi:hypothetical protein